MKHLSRLSFFQRSSEPTSQTRNEPEIDSATSNDKISWPGFNSLKSIFVFGDSYSAFGSPGKPRPPTKINRNTVPHDDNGTNWVGFLLMDDCCHRKLVVHDYAVGGARVPAVGWGAAVETQVDVDFLTGYPMQRKWKKLPWDSADSLFVTWVGINDCAYAQTHEDTLALLFVLQEKLYAAGARLFLFIDVPPIGRTPAGAKASSDISTTYLNWNSSLRDSVQKFSSAHPDARVLTFSAFDAFNRILDNLGEHGIPEEDASRSGGTVWRDHLHPTSKIHQIFARDLVEFLKGANAEDS
ncbi:glycosyltransferase family 32 protein [Favolaschia claudopus]|uniref:Glycosyltransferase family 32 protein n=1 Tax=Favolaschia claudopus TaxID=2862362 RepID=A0AAW0E2W7_9AGAR